MEIFFGVIVGLVILMILVALHELGHAVAARKSGVVVEEFAIGFPPRVLAKKLQNGILFTLNWLPLGGFVRFQGEYDSADQPGDYGAASYLKKTGILFAGVAVNWLVAAVLLTILAWVGLPKLLPNQFFIQSDTTVISYPVEVVTIVESSPADKAGLKQGDKIISLAGEEVSSADQVSAEAKDRQGEIVALVYERGDQQYTTTVQLNADDTAKEDGYLGAGIGQRGDILKAGWSAPITGVVTTAQLSWETLVGVKDLVVRTAQGVAMRISPNEETREKGKADLGEAAENVAGPIGILGVIFPMATQGGLASLLFITALISLTLAVMNILPIPALDGGRWLTMTIFRLIRAPLTKEREETIQGIGVMLLVSLMIVVTLTDIGKLF